METRYHDNQTADAKRQSARRYDSERFGRRLSGTFRIMFGSSVWGGFVGHVIGNRSFARATSESCRPRDRFRARFARRISYSALVPSDLTRLLSSPKSAEELLPLVYEELRRLAAARMANEQPGHTLQPTALVHEAWLRLGGEAQPAWENRAHFFGAASEAMRRILIERARRRLAAKRGGGQAQLDVDQVEIPSPADDEQVLAVNEALEKFTRVDPRKAELVKLRYFVGMSFEEAASALGVAVPTAKQWWAYARAWLTVEMRTALPA